MNAALSMEPTGLQDLEGFKNLQGLSFNLPCLQGYHIAANGNTIITCVEGLGKQTGKRNEDDGKLNR